MHQSSETRVCIYFGARLASFDHLGLISDPLVVSKFHNEIYDPKGQENQIYTIVKPAVYRLKGQQAHVFTSQLNGISHQPLSIIICLGADIST